MKIEKASITILIDRDYTRIEIHDENASTTFVRVKLTAEQLASALSRLSHTQCEAEVFGLDKLGKIHENKKHIFEVPSEWGWSPDKDKLFELAKTTAPEGWAPDNHFNSQDTLFNEDGKRFCRVNIRRWVDKND